MKMKNYLFLLCLIYSLQSVGQIAYHGFEQNAGDTWNVTFSTPPCTNGQDRWDYSTSLSSIIPSAGTQFWGITDLNGNCGSAGGETMTFSNISVTGQVGVFISFDYNILGYDLNDDVFYTVVIDGIDQPEVQLIDGVNGGGVSTTGYATETINIPNGSTTVGLRVRVVQNGPDFAGFDNFIVDVNPCPNTTTYTIAGGWDNGLPNATTEAVIAEDYSTNTANITACSIIVNDGATLTINAGQWVSVVNNVEVEGSLVIGHEGSLVQTDAAAQCLVGPSGSIEVRKTTPTLAPLGFMFLSSPLSAETRDGVYGSAFRVIEVVSSNFTVDPALETTDPMDPYFGAEIFLGPDNSFLSNLTASEALTPGDGLVVYPQASITDGNSSYNLTYSQGQLNTGDITYPIQYNGQTKDNFNLLGNPYASAIDMDLLIDNNDMINEVYFWEHLTPPSTSIPGYLDNNYSMDDISVYTKAGAVGSGTAADNGGTAPGRYMASGQGFAIKAIEGGSANLLFSNSMRVVDNNDQYRNSEDKDRIWISLHNQKYDLHSTSLVAFLPEASPRMDKGFDARRIGSSISLFSKSLEGDALSIQATSAFDKTMQLEMGMASVVEENLQFSIAIQNKEGVFANGQEIYLIDTYTGAVTNLNQSDYRFTAVNGMQDNRFVLSFEAPEQLSVTQATLASSLRLFPNPAQERFTVISSEDLRFERLTIRSLQGQIVKSLSLKDMDKQQTISIGDLASGIYLVEIANKFSTTTKKLIVE